MNRLQLLSISVVLSALVPASAGASFAATGTDPAGDASSPTSDITQVRLTHNARTGQLTAAVVTREPGRPGLNPDDNVAVYAGRTTAGGCDGYPSIGFADGTWARFAGPGDPIAQGSAPIGVGDDESQAMAVETPAFRGVTPDCVLAQTFSADGTITDVAGPFRLVGEPELSVSFGRAPTLRPGVARKIRVTLRNSGHASTGRLRLRADSNGRGSVRVARTVAAIAPGKSRTITVMVKLQRRSIRRPTLKLDVTGRDVVGLASPRAALRANDSVRLRLKRPLGETEASTCSLDPSLCW